MTAKNGFGNTDRMGGRLCTGANRPLSQSFTDGDDFKGPEEVALIVTARQLAPQARGSCCHSGRSPINNNI
ncbi:hypothetical protein INR49_028674 [Caranx melampygus]|nr:hypothetical protein INR49_028674 [Caranx melampygus]